jgi:hypothetical protein
MGLQFYKPNSRNAGVALGITFNSKDAAVYLEFIKQNGWNNETKNGVFKGGEKGNVKLSLPEVGGFIDTIETVLSPILHTVVEEGKKPTVIKPQSRNFSGYHTVNNNSTKIAFLPYTDKGTGELKGLSLSVKKTTTGENPVDLSFLIGFTFAEAVLLREYLKFALEHVFSAIYSADKKQAEDYKKKKDAAAKEGQAPEGESSEVEDPLA